MDGRRISRAVVTYVAGVRKVEKMAIDSSGHFSWSRFR
jgi:hypothetical protein